MIIIKINKFQTFYPKKPSKVLFHVEVKDNSKSSHSIDDNFKPFVIKNYPVETMLLDKSFEDIH
jgi:hypothetical protein